MYAIPGNHDWYDALEAFAATFLQADAARASIHARADADLRVTSTTDDRIEELIREAERLRQAYGVPTGFQRAPFFELQTSRFALVAVDTGVLRSIDTAQAAWLEAALNASPGVQAFQSAARDLGLGYRVTLEKDIVTPAYQGSVELRDATVPGEQD